jgi:hypothetical protein
MKRPGVSLLILWEEYDAAYPEGYGYSRFCELYRAFERHLSPTMRQTHVAGHKAFVDYSGKRVAIADPLTGEIRTAEIFVGVLGASNLTYAEATWTQTLPDWISVHVRMFRFFGAAPRPLEPDNLRSAVNKPSSRPRPRQPPAGRSNVPGISDPITSASTLTAADEALYPPSAGTVVTHLIMPAPAHPLHACGRPRSAIVSKCFTGRSGRKNGPALGRSGAPSCRSMKPSSSSLQRISSGLLASRRPDQNAESQAEGIRHKTGRIAHLASKALTSR